MRFNKRTDANHVTVINELRKRGCTVFDLNASGGGLTDIVAYYRGNTVFIEIKVTKEKGGTNPVVKKTQLKFLGEWRGHCGIARTADEAFALVSDPEYHALTDLQKDKLLAFHAMMGTGQKQVALSVIEKLIS